MQTEKEKWIDDVLKCADGLSRAAGPDMTAAILSRLNEAGSFTIRSRARDNSLVRRVAASVAFLLALNGATVYSYQNNINHSHRAMSTQAAASELGLTPSLGTDVSSAIFGN